VVYRIIELYINNSTYGSYLSDTERVDYLMALNGTGQREQQQVLQRCLNDLIARAARNVRGDVLSGVTEN
jgi:hypothetical protein